MPTGCYRHAKLCMLNPKYYMDNTPDVKRNCSIERARTEIPADKQSTRQLWLFIEISKHKKTF